MSVIGGWMNFSAEAIVVVVMFFLWQQRLLVFVTGTTHWFLGPVSGRNQTLITEAFLVHLWGC